MLFAAEATPGKHPNFAIASSRDGVCHSIEGRNATSANDGRPTDGGATVVRLRSSPLNCSWGYVRRPSRVVSAGTNPKSQKSPLQPIDAHSSCHVFNGCMA